LKVFAGMHCRIAEGACSSVKVAMAALDGG